MPTKNKSDLIALQEKNERLIKENIKHQQQIMKLNKEVMHLLARYELLTEKVDLIEVEMRDGVRVSSLYED